MTQKEVKFTRRHMMEMGAGFASVLALSAPSAATLSSDHKASNNYPKVPEWLTYLGKSEVGSRHYTPEVEGKIPSALKGTLYRNGPGLFERGDTKKAHMLDGDGLVQSLKFDQSGVTYRNEFVQTPKFKREKAAGRFVNATWTTRAPGGILNNAGGHSIEAQAGVTIYPVGDKLYALDESNPIFEIDPDTLETKGSMPLGGEKAPGGIKAHTKFDPVTGEWLSMAASMGRTMTLHTISYKADGSLNYVRDFESPRQCYLHDFFITQNYFVFILHPLELQAMKFLSGTHSFTDSLIWKGDKGNLIAICPRSGGEAKFIEAPSSFMWHSLNAYEEKGKIIADFSAYAEPDHFVGEDAFMYNFMQGHMGKMDHKGKVRRYEIDIQSGTATEDIISHDNHEFAMADPRVYGNRHTFGYFASGGISDITTGISSVNYNTMEIRNFNFSTPTHVGEPVIIPKPHGQIDDCWIITQCLDSKTMRTFFAIFDTTSFTDGPLAKIWLSHHVPISFHGAWKNA